MRRRPLVISLVLIALLLLAAAAVCLRFPAARQWLGHLLRGPLPKAGPERPPFDPALVRLSPVEIASLPLAVRFDHPLGSAHGALTYDAQPFLLNRHLGSDLNGIGGGNTDFGDPVHAAGDGRVIFAGEGGPGWGLMVIVAHRLGEPGKPVPVPPRVVQTVYAHLQSFSVEPMQAVARGQKIGAVGTGGGLYFAHLHFEVREGTVVNPAEGYASQPLNRLPPTPFLQEHRGAPPERLNQPAP